ncbi:transcription termination/antitermination protein NusA [bacterium]|jgi:N utilization substance protein A|nr:transcription termination/antitermination protein NusA [bacterium]MDP6571381.1 transcription termination factor NusA [Patescibacteria group bacterium]|tara:strand:+ start:15872 stop:17317 length:1446 start_codon:yes stop_codon:yes gene_type:complete
MSKEVLQAIKAICEEKHIPVESVLATIDQALAAAYRKDFGDKMQNLKVEFNPETMDIKVFDVKEVVEDQELDEEGNVVVEGEDDSKESDDDSKPAQGGSASGGKSDDDDKTKKDDDKDEKKEERDSSPPKADQDDGDTEEEEEERFNPKTQIMITEAKEIKKDVKIGEELVQELEVPGEFGRMAAQTAKQVIIQRLREAEREVVFNEYKDKEGELINGSIQRTEAGNVLVDIGQATAIMPPQEQVKGEHYAPGAQLRFYIKSVATTNRGPEVIVSRTDKELVRQLFIMEVPEIADQVVELKSIAREPGNRSKIAVYTEEENVDPVGSCVGQRGTRVQFIINELGGEKIDIIEWDENDIGFIKNALAPAKVVDVELDEENKTAIAKVSEDQFSLAIGKQGQNVRLASGLTGWKIDIKESKESGKEESEEEADEPTEDKPEDKVEEKESEPKEDKEDKPEKSNEKKDEVKDEKKENKKKKSDD